MEDTQLRGESSLGWITLVNDVVQRYQPDDQQEIRGVLVGALTTIKEEFLSLSASVDPQSALELVAKFLETLAPKDSDGRPKITVTVDQVQ